MRSLATKSPSGSPIIVRKLVTTIDPSKLTAAAPDQLFDLVGAVPAGYLPVAWEFEVAEAFTPVLDEWFATLVQDINDDTQTFQIQAALTAVAKFAAPGRWIWNVSTGQQVQLQVVTNGAANVNTATAGLLKIWLILMRLP